MFPHFVTRHTAPGYAPLVPELALLLGTSVEELWRKTQDIGGPHAAPPYWAFAWPGGQALARYVLDHPAEVLGRTVLDIGAGSGLIAIAAAKMGAAQVTAADIDPFAEVAIRMNAANNHVALETMLGDAMADDAGLRWQTILAGDVCYERALAEPILAWLARAAAQGARVLIADPGRDYFPKTALMEQLAVYDVPTLTDLESHDMRPTGVYAITL